MLYENLYKKKFSFGKNWQNFNKNITNKNINNSIKYFKNFTKFVNLKNKTFIDVGCGSGINSLLAIKLNAKKVLSIDIDENSVSACKLLRKKYKISNKNWIIKQVSILDTSKIKKLGKFDFIYSWGVLHHTGDMNKAFDNLFLLAKKKSYIYVSIYNKYLTSNTWKIIKYFYASSNNFIKKIMEKIYITIYYIGLNLNKYSIKEYKKSFVLKRGMSFRHDIIDWLGGYPYEYLSFEDLSAIFFKKGYSILSFKKSNGVGCNEIFVKR